MKALVGALIQVKALVGAFSVIVQPVVEPMDRLTALAMYHHISRCMLCIIHSIFANAPRVSLQSDLQMLDGEFVNEEKLLKRK